MSISLSLAVYTVEAVLKTAYLFLDQCYLFVDIPDPGDPETLTVYFSPSGAASDLERLAGEFGNRLIWQQVREKVAEETRPIREAIVTMAFVEAGTTPGLDDVDGDYNTDPLGIGN
jgi:His-Xaa-Ser system protein HxsD